MRGLLFALILAIIGCTTTQPAEASPSRVALAAEITAETVALVQDDGLGSLVAYCTGVWVSPRTILTALHCVKDEAVLGYVTREDVYPHGTLSPDLLMQARGALVMLIDTQHDLALLRAFAPPPAHGVAHMRVGTIAPGMQAQTVGHSLAWWFSYSSGDVSAVRQTDLGDGNDVLWIQCTTPTSPGNSGGGLFDHEGSLMGVAHAVASQGQQLNFYVHAKYIESLLARARQLSAL
jgi:serine protease Do